MDATYKLLAAFAQSAGVIYFMAIFFAVIAYAIWPSNRGKFEEAARIPLNED